MWTGAWSGLGTDVEGDVVVHVERHRQQLRRRHVRPVGQPRGTKESRLFGVGGSWRDRFPLNKPYLVDSWAPNVSFRWGLLSVVGGGWPFKPGKISLMTCNEIIVRNPFFNGPICMGRSANLDPGGKESRQGEGPLCQGR